jgi:hypothetical protein
MKSEDALPSSFFLFLLNSFCQFLLKSTRISLVFVVSPSLEEFSVSSLQAIYIATSDFFCRGIEALSVFTNCFVSFLVCFSPPLDASANYVDNDVRRSTTTLSFKLRKKLEEKKVSDAASFPKEEDEASEDEVEKDSVAGSAPESNENSCSSFKDDALGEEPMRDAAGVVQSPKLKEISFREALETSTDGEIENQIFES